jgi:hypothetical protein
MQGGQLFVLDVLARADVHEGYVSLQYSNPQRLRPPRCVSQMLNATEAITMMLSTMGVVIALIYR